MEDNISQTPDTEEQLNTQVQEPQPEKPQKKKSDIWVRIAVGILYMAILIGFFMLKIFVNDFLFDFIVLAFSVLGTFEMCRAFKHKITKVQAVLVMIFSTLTVLTFCVSDFVFKEVFKVEWGESNYTPLITLVVFIAGLATILGLLVMAHKNTSLESTGYTLIAYVYPMVFLLILAGCNHLERYSDAAILFIFLICPFSDSLALVFGRLFGKKLPKKMAPNVSPNKTLIGGFGGLVGGAIGALIVFVVYFGLCTPLRVGSFENIVFEWDSLYLFMGVGVISAVFSQFGDLVESAIKRKLGIKDMGKMLPGHGGILDRIDSSLYAGLAVCLIFTIRIMFIMS
ncbi:MAG: phosphatidate cytidylyltransferase [Clostridia bacterium]|nr:phosphatidate cytidylyltransferase [Clostridia bacterium]